ncbi:uncharacterized protein NEMAJ01_2024 [Nematocida major]|uniref:uncharacterized protein n=1 Tax=Nematocida major TaxID=1912982 RepID=UPI002008DE77|nr:uncharacterized protein NEMAJ01_2024 [Nematocida major]KAH9387128.1 hypothetical protein NEMAJ01_2024 [Nematocida major]
MRLRFGGLLCGLLAAARMTKCIYMTHKEMLACLDETVGYVDGASVYVSPWWAGHPVCIAQICRLGYAYKMRAYSCKVNTSFSLVPDRHLGKHTYTREPEKDGLHSGMDARKDEYSVKFHRTLLHMFGLRKSSGPEYDCVTVECARPGSFIQLLREGCETQTEAHYVLAALLLLSEGVDVPIETAGNRVILKERKDSEAVLVDARMGGAALYSGEEQPSEAWQVVDFFKQYRGTHKMPSTYEEFKTGDFLESPQLLILTYVGEYVKNAKELMSVMKCALVILDDMGLAGRMEDPGNVAGRLFVCTEHLLNVEAHFAPFLKTFPALAALEHLEEFKHFQNEAEAPNKAKDASDGEEEYFDARGTNCRFIGECFLLPFLAFDPEKYAYSLEGLLCGDENVEEVEKTRALFGELQACIEKKCSSLECPNDAQRQRYRDLWLKMNTQFREALGNAAPTFLNKMRVLAQITGQPQVVVDELTAHQAAMDAKGSTELTSEAIESVQALLCSISVDKDVEVTIEKQMDGSEPKRYLFIVKHVKLGPRIEQILDMSSDKKCSSKISIWPAWLGPYYNKMQKELDVAAAKYRLYGRFSSFVLAEGMHQMAIGAPGRSLPDATTEKLQEAARKAVKRRGRRPNGVLLALPVVGEDIREELVSALMLYAEQKKIALTPEHPISRLIANVIGSIDLGDMAAQYRVLEVPVATGALHKLCPTVQLSDRLHREIWCSQKIADYDVYPAKEARGLTRRRIMQCFRGYAEL